MAEVKFENLPELVSILISKVETLETSLKKCLPSTCNEVENSDQWFNIDALIKYLPDHPAKATVYSWVSKKVIPHNKVSKVLRFRKSEIDKWIESGKRKSEREIAEDASRYLSKHKGGQRYE